jgi:hypothetical protein
MREIQIQMLGLKDENQRLAQQASAQMPYDGTFQCSNTGRNPREAELEI